VTSAIVTGAASGIGRATALRLAGQGHAVAVMDIVDAAARDVASEIRAAGGHAEACGGDVSDELDIKTAVDAIVASFGPLKVASACAGVEVYGSATEMKVAEWDRAVAINLNGAMFLARNAIPRMLESDGGAFVAVGSDASVRGAAGWTPYCVTKHALVGLVRCLAIDYGPQGVRSNLVCPSFVQTPMTDRIFDDVPTEREAWEEKVPLRRFSTADEVAGAIAHLASDEASYTNGAVYMIDGGLTAGFA
jgi:NAD(P)-dependent dehydrogenase (short-subunit alcohol dehydrogenase family)